MSMRPHYTLFLLMFTVSCSSWATLGGKVESIARDRAVLKAESVAHRLDGTDAYSQTQNRNYSTHEIVVGNRAIHEFVSDQGIVFGVAWYGNSPDHVSSLLGKHYPEFIRAVKEQRANSRYRMRGSSVAIRTPALVVENGGVSDSFQGRAFLPGQLPNGVDINEIR